MTTLLERYKAQINYCFDQVFQVPKPQLRPVLSVIPVLRNSSVLFTGKHGTGKTTLVEQGYAVRFFVEQGLPSVARVRCHQELMDTNTLYAIPFTDPDGMARPRDLLKKRIRYVNELPRSTPALQNALLSFFSERQISYQDQHFDVTEGLNICDRNPEDIGQEGVVEALLDRIDLEVIIPVRGRRNLRSIPKVAPLELLTVEDMSRIWDEVGRVQISADVWEYAHMVNRYFSACVKPRTEATLLYRLPCEGCAYRNEICRFLRTTPGERGVIAMEKLARALAWFNGRTAVSIGDIEYALPYAYSHRLDLHHEIANEWPNPQVYLSEFVVYGQLEAKRERWQEAIQASLRGDLERVAELASHADDLVIAWLYHTGLEKSLSIETT